MPNTKHHILLVEDEPSLASILSETFIKRGHEVTHCNNGKDGLATALAVHPDIILLDLIMPELDGMSVLKKVRLDTWGANVPIIILTNVGGAERISEAVLLEVCEYVIKTETHLADLVDRVEARLGVVPSEQEN